MKTRVYIFALTLIVSAIIIYCFWTRLFFNDFYDDYPISDNYDPNNRSEAVSLRLVTAFSGNHFREALRSCYFIGKLDETQHWKPGFMIAYLLGDLSEAQINRYRSVCPFVKLRDFPFGTQPEFVKNLFEYRWKPIIVDEMLKEFEEVFYFDTSVIFKNDPNETIKGIFDEQKQNYFKCGIREFEPTRHTIFAATNPKMYPYFNFTEALARSNLMYGATMFTITRSEKSERIIESWVRCAREPGCMAPPHSRINCDGDKLGRGEYANCHRFDQSALGILLTQCSENPSDYFHPSSLVRVERL